MKKLIFIGVILVLLSACGGGGGSDNPPAPPGPAPTGDTTGIKCDPIPEAQTMAVTYQLRCTEAGGRAITVDLASSTSIQWQQVGLTDGIWHCGFIAISGNERSDMSELKGVRVASGAFWRAE